MAKKYYAVKNGRDIGIFTTWDKCKNSVHGYPNAKYKSFTCLKEASAYLDGSSEGNNTKENIFDDLCEDKEWIAYVDGSYNISTKIYGYGAIVFTGDKEFEFDGCGDEPELSQMRNVSGELMGVIKVIDFAVEQGASSIKIYYDYMGIECWANKEWKANKDFTKKYVQFIDDRREKICIKFAKVKAHSGDKYNEIVDKLAKKAVGLN